MAKSVFSGIAAAIYLALGIACLVIALQNPNPGCGLNGQPPLREWVFGTGISYIVIGISFSGLALLLICLTGGIAVIPLIIVWIFAGLFVFAWAIVGAVSLWRDGGDCQTIAYPLWAVAMAAEIVTLIMIFFTCCSVKNASSEDE